MFSVFAFCQKQQYFSIPDFFKFYPVPPKQPQLWSKSTHRNVSPQFRILRPRAIKQNMFQGAENSLRTSNMALKLIGHVYLSRLYTLLKQTSKLISYPKMRGDLIASFSKIDFSHSVTVNWISFIWIYHNHKQARVGVNHL